MEMNVANSHTTTAPLLQCINLSKSYGALGALNAVNLILPRGRIVGLLGPNGSGKTTLIKMIAGILTPTSGTILVNNQPIGVETKKAVSYLPERTYFDGSQRVIDTVNFFSDFYSDFDRSRAFELLNSLAIPMDIRFRALSKGTKEKLQLILVMSRNADLYLLDEPIAGVDPAARDYILNVVLRNYNRSASILLSTHLIYDIEPILDDAVFLSRGCLYLADTCDNIRRNTGGSVDRLFREVFRC